MSRHDSHKSAHETPETRAEVDRPDWLAPKPRRYVPPALASLAAAALAVRCPICRARRGHYCSGEAYELPRHRIGRELLHVERFNRTVALATDLSPERAAAAAVIHTASTTTTPDQPHWKDTP